MSTVSIYRQEEPAMGGMSGEEPEPGIGMCGWLLTSISWFVVIITLPFSLCVCFKVSGSARSSSSPKSIIEKREGSPVS